MRVPLIESLRTLLKFCFLIWALSTSSAALWAQDGTWISSVDGVWSNAANWAPGDIANGANNTANFNTLDISDQTGATGFPAVGIDLDSPRTIGHMIFGDTNAATPGAWDLFTLDQTNNVLTLADATKPTITVNPLGPVGATNQDAARVLVNLAGINGFTKLGNGVLGLGSPTTNFTNFTGSINVDAGTVRANAGATFDIETVVTPAVASFNVASGATLENASNTALRNIAAASGAILQVRAGTPASGGFGANVTGTTGGVNIAPGGTVTINHNSATTQVFSNISGTGATVNFNILAVGTNPASIARDWAQNGALAAINFKGSQVGSNKSLVRLLVNGGGFNANSFATTTVSLDTVTLVTTTGSTGNTIPIGALTGTSTAVLEGGNGAGSFATYVIGGLDTNTTFAGGVTTGKGLNLIKVGDGILELSGTLSYAPTNNAILNRRGGTTRVEAGTLKLTGPAAIPGGSVDLTVGNLISTIDIRSGATLDVSGAATASTANLQQLIGTGKIVGNYTHGQGMLAPGDTNVDGNSQTLTSVPGTLTFDNNLSFAGNGAISFSLGNSPASGNDLIQVNGTANLDGSVTVTPSFPSGIPATGQTFTLLNAAGGFGSSTPAGWVVSWPGRGAGPSVFTAGNNVQIISAPILSHNLNWSGADNADWNTTTANWYNNTQNAAGNYVEFDNVTFADTANGVPVTNTNVNLPGVVNPSAVTVDSTIEYTIAGNGQISGNGSLTKRGSSTLNLTGANTYAGGTTIEGGIIDLGPAGKAGSGAITLAGGALHAGQAATFTLANAIQVNGSGNVISNDNIGGQGLVLNGSISGSGNLDLQNNSLGNGVDPPVINGIDVFGNNAGFTGSVSFSGPTPIVVRLRTDGAEGTNVAWDLGNNGSTLGALVGTLGADTVFQLGSLTGGTLSTLSGHFSSAGVGSSTYEIGGLGTSTSFSGAIMDGKTDTNTGNFTSLTKVGAGTLTLDNMVDANLADTITLYSGDTRVQGGTLSIAQPYLANLADVYIASGSVFDLNTAGAIDIIDSLYLGNMPQIPGTYGSLASSATFKSPFFTGSGILDVTTLGAPIPTDGDFDGDGDVDGRDFLVWQRDPSVGDLADWQTNYGFSPLAATLAATAVPEPGAALMALACGLAVLAVRKRS